MGAACCKFDGLVGVPGEHTVPEAIAALSSVTLEAGSDPERTFPSLFESLAVAGFSEFPWKEGDKVALEWVNLALKRAWPDLKGMLERKFKKNMAYQIREALPSWTEGHVSLDKFVIGDTPPTVSMVRSVAANEGIRVLLSAVVDSGIDAELSVGPIKLGVEKIKMFGDVAIEVSPLFPESPVAGAVNVFLTDSPSLQYQWTGLAKIAQLPLIKRAVRSAIDNFIASQYVYPNSFQKLVADEAELKTRKSLGGNVHPLGVLLIESMSAKGLESNDWKLSLTGIRRSCDPYLRFTLGAQERTTSTVKGTADPKWPEDEAYELVVYDKQQVLKCEVYDDDWMNEDDFLGQVKPQDVGQALASETDRYLYGEVTYLKQRVAAAQDPRQGTVKYKCTMLEPCADSATSSVLVVAKFFHVFLPRGVAESVQVRLRVGERVSVTPERLTPTGDVKSRADSLSTDMLRVIHNGHRKGMPVDTLAELTGLSRAVIAQVIKSGKTIASLAARVPLEALLAVPMKCGALVSATFQLELLNQNQDVIGSISVPGSEVALLWPLPESPSNSRQYALTSPQGYGIDLVANVVYAGVR
mmetsp:Transcript_15259/g.45234  ORF Transcript_15259/g.45234 Transcript_15259/m.45234 type:complete len:584 (-) Transcript_15259:158-1909(-)